MRHSQEGSCGACLNFKTSRASALSMSRVAVTIAVGNLKNGYCLS